MSTAPEPLLSNEETDALLDAMRAGDGSMPDIEGADLISPEPRIRAALGSVDRTSARLARETGTILLRHTGCTASVEPQPAEVTPFSVLASAIAPGTAIATVHAADGSFGLLTLGPSLVTFILDRQMGAPLSMEEPMEDEQPPRAQLSPVDKRILGPICAEVLATIGDLWCDDVETLTMHEIVANPNELPELEQFEPLLRVSMRAVPAAWPGDDITLALTANAVGATIGIPEEEAPPPASASERQKMALRIGGTEVDVVCVLGEASSSVGHVLTLEVGDVVRLDAIPGKPSELRVEGVMVLIGNPVVHHGNLAVEVTPPG